MRLIKENTAEYESFHKSLQYFTKSSESKGELKLINFESHRGNANLIERYSFFTQNLAACQNRILSASNLIEINLVFQDFLKRIIMAKEAEIFFLTEGSQNIVPLNGQVNPAHHSAVVKAFKNGILDWIFETKKATILTDFNAPINSNTKLNQILFPLFDQKANYGLLSIATPVSKISENSLEYQAIQILLGITMPAIMNLKNKQTINKLYQEVQVYQSKINNDSDIYALGEMTEGILENILEPLQVILSYVDIIESEETVENEITSKIKDQVKKVSELTSRLGKYISLNKPSNKQHQSCDLNKIVKEFNVVVSSTMQNLGLDCDLDLEENIPPVLSDPNDIKQLFAGVFSILKSGAKSGGAVVIQTKYIKEKVVLSFFTTEQIPVLNDPKKFESNVTVKIIKELMKKNEGSAEFNSLPLKGTIIHLVFPLKRKLSL
jgi:hypothetical protein